MAGRTDRVGQQIGEYRLLRWLGGGGFGDVYVGEQVRTQQQVAVKILQTRLTGSEELKEFINEARTFRLRHPHIVQLLDFGIGSDDVPFLVMEYAAQGTLRERHPKGSRLPLATMLSYVTPLASALQYAHDVRLIHRDVKPENMLLGSHHEVLLSDFGIAAVAQSSRSLATQEGIGGTLPYMAPEQIQGKPRPASDQYALGIVVYEWITGTRPFTGTAVEIAIQHSQAPVPSLRAHVPALSPDVEQVVLTALAKDPGQRFARVEAFAVALEAACAQTRSSTPIPPLHVTVVPPLPVEEPTQQAGLPVAATVFSPSPPVLEPRSLVTRPREETLEPVTQGGTSPVVPMSTRAYPGPQRAATPRRSNRNRFFPRRTAILLGVVLLIVAGSVGIAFTTLSHPLTADQVTATVRAQATASVNAALTATANAQQVATAHTQATVMAATDAYATAVGTNGIMFGFDAQHTHVNPYEQILNTTTVSGLTKQWAYPTGKYVFSSAAVANGVVYVGSYDGNLYALDATSGSKKWAYKAGDRIYSSPAIANGVVYVGSFDGNVYAVDAASGNKQWNYKTGNFVASSPVVVNGVVYVGSDDGNVYALDAASGNKQWNYKTGGAVDSSPVVVNGVVYVGSGDGNVYAFDLPAPHS